MRIQNIRRWALGQSRRPRAASIFLALLLVGGLSGCAFTPEEFESAAATTGTAPQPEKRRGKPAENVSGVGGIPVVGAIFAALFRPEPLPEDDEIAVPLAAAIDGTPPRLQVHFVQGGRLRAYGPEILVRGTVSDASRVALVTVNGYAARINGNGFSRRIRVPVDTHRSVAQALDIHGNAALVQFDIVRRVGRDGGAPVRAGAGSQAGSQIWRGRGGIPRQIRSLDDINVPGAFLILLAGTAAMHAVPMPSFAHCRLAASYSQGGTCAERR